MQSLKTHPSVFLPRWELLLEKVNEMQAANQPIDLNYWEHTDPECGTVYCIIGACCVDPRFIKDGLQLIRLPEYPATPGYVAAGGKIDISLSDFTAVRFYFGTDYMRSGLLSDVFPEVPNPQDSNLSHHIFTPESYIPEGAEDEDVTIDHRTLYGEIIRRIETVCAYIQERIEEVKHVAEHKEQSTGI